MSDWWYPGQLARQDEYGDTPPANWPVPQVPEQDAFEAAAARVRAPYRNLQAPGSNRIGQLAEQVTSMPSWADVATQQMNKDKEAYQAGGIGGLLADTSVAQELAGGFGGTTKAVGKPVIGELASPFYSAAQRAVEGAKMTKGTPEQWLGYLRNQPGVKQEELQHVFGNLPKEGALTKAQMEAHAAENAVTLGEVSKGGRDPKEGLKTFYERVNSGERMPAWEQLTQQERSHWLDEYDKVSPTKYSQWQLPGGENYRETLLTLPSEMPETAKATINNYNVLNRRMADQMAEWKGLAEARPPGDPETLAAYQRLAATRREANAAEDAATKIKQQYQSNTFRSSHWDEPNVLAHVRTNDREIPGVGKSLHVEEIQSDWHQKGRQGGYAVSDADRGSLLDERTKMSLVAARGHYDQPEVQAANRRMAEIDARLAQMDKGGVPDAPFKSTWADVALKRQIREASEKGYDAISWTPGKAQSDRYKLSNQLKELQYLKNDEGTYEIAGITKSGDGFNHPGQVTADKLADVVGKDMAQKIINNEGKRARGHSPNSGYFDGIDLEIGGEGMRAFYDKMLVDKANAIAKKHGARVERGPVLSDQEITPGTFQRILRPELDANGEWRIRQQGSAGYWGPVGEHRIKFASEADALANIRSMDAPKGDPIHVLRITPELRAAAMKGFPLFTAGGVVAGGTMGELARQDKYGKDE